MKGSVFCASGNDLILVLMHSLNGGKENKLVTNYLMKEMRTIWHHLCSLIYQNGKELGEPGTRPSRRKEHFSKGAERGGSGQSQNREEAATHSQRRA